jgi:hypothetical protein
MSNRVSVMGGLLALFQNKIKDEEVVRACSEMLFKFAETHSVASPRNDPRSLFSAIPQAHRSTPVGGSSAAADGSTHPPVLIEKMALPVSEYRNSEGQIWEYEAISLAVQALDHMCVGSSGKRPSSTGKRDSESKGSKDKDKYREVEVERDRDRDRDREKERDDRKDKEEKDKSPGSVKAAPIAVKGVSSWSKHTPKSILSVVALMEIISTLPKVACQGGLMDSVRFTLQSVLVVLPPKHSETTRRIEKFLSKLLISHPIPVAVSIPVSVPVPTRGTGAAAGEDPAPSPLFPVLPSRNVFTSKPSSRETSERVKEIKEVKEVKETADTQTANIKAISAGNTFFILFYGLSVKITDSLAILNILCETCSVIQECVACSLNHDDFTSVLPGTSTVIVGRNVSRHVAILSLTFSSI